MSRCMDFIGLLPGIEVDPPKVHWATITVVIDAIRDDAPVVLIKKIHVTAADV